MVKRDGLEEAAAKADRVWAKGESPDHRRAKVENSMIARIIGRGPLEAANVIAGREAPMPGPQGKGELAKKVGTSVEAPAPKPLLDRKVSEQAKGFGFRTDQQAAELFLGSKPGAAYANGFVEKHAKIQYDKHSRTITIQIIDSASGEVVREIPADAWRLANQHIPLPKGTLFDL